jgi:hypothetical protein
MTATEMEELGLTKGAFHCTLFLEATSGVAIAMEVNSTSMRIRIVGIENCKMRMTKRFYRYADGRQNRDEKVVYD